MVSISLKTKCNSVKELEFHGEFVTNDYYDRFGFGKFHKPLIENNLLPSYSDIVIVGGGLIGSSIAGYLKINLLGRKTVVIVDDSDFLTQKFHEQTVGINQAYMRSNYDQHIAPDGLLSLVDFARINWDKLTILEKNQVSLALLGERSVVPTDLFLAHTRFTCNCLRLSNNAVKAKALEIRKACSVEQYILSTNLGCIYTPIIILATGNINNQSLNPTGSKRYYNAYTSPTTRDERGGRAAMIGKGMTAAHKVIKLLKSGVSVDWYVGGEITYQCADCPTEYFRTEGVAKFRKLNVEDRIELLARSKGTMSPEFHTAFSVYINSGQLNILPYTNTVNPRSIVGNSSERSLELDSYDNVFVASGLKPNNHLDVEGLIYRDGYFEVTNELECVENNGMFVVGNSACLGLGPAARTIDGARLAISALKERVIEILRLDFRLPEPQTGFCPLGAR